MRIFAAILIVLLCLLGVVYIAGRMQPEEHLATRSAIIAAPPAQVWARINAAADEPRWRPSVKSVSVDAPQNGLPCFTEQIGIALRLCVTRLDGERLRVVSVADSKGNFSGTWTFLVQPGNATEAAGNSTRVTITEDATVTSTLWRGVMVLTGMDRNVRQYLHDLSRSFSGTPEQS